MQGFSNGNDPWPDVRGSERRVGAPQEKRRRGYWRCGQGGGGSMFSEGGGELCGERETN